MAQTYLKKIRLAPFFHYAHNLKAGKVLNKAKLFRLITYFYLVIIKFASIGRT